MRLAVWKGCVHEVPYCDLTCLGADGTDSSDPLVTRAHRVRIRVSVLLEQAQVQVEMLPSERRSTSVKGDLRAVADAADHRIHAHLIDPQRGIVVRRDRDRSRRSYQQLIWHRPVSRGFAWTVAIIVTRPSPALAPRQPGARPWAVLSLSRRTTAESTKGSTGLSRVPAGRCSITPRPFAGTFSRAQLAAAVPGGLLIPRSLVRVQRPTRARSPAASRPRRIRDPTRGLSHQSEASWRLVLARPAPARR